MIRPRPSLAPSWKAIVPIAVAVVVIGLMPAAVRSFTERMNLGRWGDLAVYFAAGASMLVVVVGAILHRRASASTAFIASHAQLFLRTIRPESGQMEVLDLLARNPQGDDPVWVPSPDELRALAAWLSLKTGWTVETA